nr:MAG TPA: hypothetical protein [Caudoviricetes sp.]
MLEYSISSTHFQALFCVHILILCVRCVYLKRYFRKIIQIYRK